MTQYINSNMNNAEAYRLLGTLPADRIEALLDIEAIDVSGAIVHIEEARGCYPAEDVMSETLQAMRDLRCNLRGNNKALMDSIISMVEDLETELRQSAEYGADELRKALEVLNHA